jgi:hypothetical protein
MSDRVNLSEFNLLILTPIGSRPDDTYCSALDKTMQLIREYGGQVEVFKTRGISDIYYARSKLFGAFLRNKKYTHALMIDDDMEWQPEEVVWFLLLKRDMLAAVGTKKVFPIEFAWNMVGDDGKQMPLIHETETNVAEVPFVGAAFMMISRNCAERLAAAYPELQYDSVEKNVETDIFSPIILTDKSGNRRRLADDFALCYRWRKIGGKVEVKLDVTLGHTGSHTFKGNLLHHLTTNNRDFNPQYAVFPNAAA